MDTSKEYVAMCDHPKAQELGGFEYYYYLVLEKKCLPCETGYPGGYKHCPNCGGKLLDDTEIGITDDIFLMNLIKSVGLHRLDRLIEAADVPFRLTKSSGFFCVDYHAKNGRVDSIFEAPTPEQAMIQLVMWVKFGLTWEGGAWK
ncbi:MAG: hypothetical protein JEY79_18035 [Pseudodesulfovibrio sp.]|nr:hypothetical protein [Pseudodesulfovibrio sp.]